MSRLFSSTTWLNLAALAHHPAPTPSLHPPPPPPPAYEYLPSHQGLRLQFRLFYLDAWPSGASVMVHLDGRLLYKGAKPSGERVCAAFDVSSRCASCPDRCGSPTLSQPKATSAWGAAATPWCWSMSPMMCTAPRRPLFASQPTSPRTTRPRTLASACVSILFSVWRPLCLGCRAWLTPFLPLTRPSRRCF